MTVRVWQAEQGWIDPSQNRPGKAAAADGSGLVGLEIALYRQGLANGQPYRKVVVLP
jgi:hypothetical protein